MAELDCDVAKLARLVTAENDGGCAVMGGGLDDFWQLLLMVVAEQDDGGRRCWWLVARVRGSVSRTGRDGGPARCSLFAEVDMTGLAERDNGGDARLRCHHIRLFGERTRLWVVAVQGGRGRMDESRVR